jgi:hypothetical protein
VSGLTVCPGRGLSKALPDGAAVAFVGARSHGSAGSFGSFVDTGSSGGSTCTHRARSGIGIGWWPEIDELINTSPMLGPHDASVLRSTERDEGTPVTYTFQEVGANGPRALPGAPGAA